MILDAEFSEKLRQVLSDPDAMSKITAIASGLGKTEANGAQAQSEQSRSALSDTDKPSLPSLSLQSSDPRLALLASLKPLIREDRRDRVDALTQALTLASVMKNFRK